MKTKEVEEQLGITKDALRYYEKENLIKPSRDSNGYRNYSQEDIRILKNIMMFRLFNLSIDEIKMIFNNEASLNECLLNKKQDFQNEIKERQKTIELIDKNLMRKKAYFGYLEIPKTMQEEVFILFKTNEVIMTQSFGEETSYIKYKYQDIAKIHFSLCSRTYLPALNNKGYRFFQERPHVGLLSRYYVDLDLYTKKGQYLFESISLDNIKEIFTVLTANNVIIEDPLGLKEVFNQYQNIFDLDKYFDGHIRKWQKMYQLDNPRGTDIYDQIDQFHNYINEQSQNNKTGLLFYLHSLQDSGVPKPIILIILLFTIGWPIIFIFIIFAMYAMR